ncbi:MAG: hypothetical protein ACKO85_02685 [Isosphaeraceae bacterium]
MIRFRNLYLAFFMALAGCGGGDGLDRQPVTGQVVLDGQPLKDAEILFFPTSNGKDAIATGAHISNGAYTISRENGPIPGNYKVQITAAGGAQAPPANADAMPGTGPIHAKELIPARYNVQTTLTADVKAGETNKFDFTLSTK